MDHSPQCGQVEAHPRLFGQPQHADEHRRNELCVRDTVPLYAVEGLFRVKRSIITVVAPTACAPSTTSLVRCDRSGQG